MLSIYTKQQNDRRERKTKRQYKKNKLLSLTSQFHLIIYRKEMSGFIKIENHKNQNNILNKLTDRRRKKVVDSCCPLTLF